MRTSTWIRGVGAAVLVGAITLIAAAGPIDSADVSAAPGPAPYGYADFFGVPRLGNEASRGTGCGGDGSIGDVIPDGYWRGFVRSFDGPSLQFDLICVYPGATGVRLADEFYRADPEAPNYWWPDGWPVSNNPRTRTVAVGSSFFSHGTVVADDGSVPFAQPGVPFDADSNAWILIAGGQAQWAVSGPASLATPTVPPPPAPAAASYGYADFFGVPQLGTEPVRGTGCGGDGSLGDAIPDGYWRGFVRAWDGPSLVESATMQFDVMCVYVGDVADQLAAEFAAANPGEAEMWWPDGWPVNSNDRTRSVPIGPGFFAHGTTFADDGTAPFAQPDVPFDQSLNTWARIVDGAAVWAVSSPSFS
jgi:hypothetical protein